jgi:hypothetical protein
MLRRLGPLTCSVLVVIALSSTAFLNCRTLTAACINQGCWHGQQAYGGYFYYKQQMGCAGCGAWVGAAPCAMAGCFKVCGVQLCFSEFGCGNKCCPLCGSCACAPHCLYTKANGANGINYGTIKLNKGYCKHI